MEQFITEIRAYCDARGVSPQRFLREAVNAEWSRWETWVSGQSTPTLATVEKLRAHIAQHPPVSPSDAA